MSERLRQCSVKKPSMHCIVAKVSPVTPCSYLNPTMETDNNKASEAKGTASVSRTA